MVGGSQQEWGGKSSDTGNAGRPILSSVGEKLGGHFG